MKNKIEKNNTYTFFVDDDVYTVLAPDELPAMAKMNEDVVAKEGLQPMRWLGNQDDSSIEEKSFYCYRKK